MTLDDYMTDWSQDSNIQLDKVHFESLKVPQLHSKYMNFLTSERIKYRKLLEKRNKLSSDLESYYLGQLDGRDIGREAYQILETKTSALKKVQSDQDMIKLNLNIILQEEIVLFLKDVIQSIHNRNFSIKNYIDYQKFLLGS